MEFAATLAYVHNWSGEANTTNNESGASEHDERDFVPSSKITYPARSDFHDRSLKSTVAALKEDRTELVKGFNYFQKTVLLGDTCILDSAAALTARIRALLAQKPDGNPTPSDDEIDEPSTRFHKSSRLRMRSTSSPAPSNESTVPPPNLHRQNPLTTNARLRSIVQSGSKRFTTASDASPKKKPKFY